MSPSLACRGAGCVRPYLGSMWSVDRRVAASAFVAATLALAIPLAASDAPAPSRGDDPVVLAEELAALANLGARAAWIVTYGFTRVTAACTRRSSRRIGPAMVGSTSTTASGRSS